LLVEFAVACTLLLSSETLTFVRSGGLGPRTDMRETKRSCRTESCSLRYEDEFLPEGEVDEGAGCHSLLSTYALHLYDVIAHVNCPAAADRTEASRKFQTMATVDMMG
jgi:hypothetical protein